MIHVKVPDLFVVQRGQTIEAQTAGISIGEDQCLNSRWLSQPKVCNSTYVHVIVSVLGTMPPHRFVFDLTAQPFGKR